MIPVCGKCKYENKGDNEYPCSICMQLIDGHLKATQYKPKSKEVYKLQEQLSITGISQSKVKDKIKYNKIIKVGKKKYTYKAFTDAVKLAKSLSELCKILDINYTVSTNVNNVKSKIVELGLNTTHFKYNRATTEKVLESHKKSIKQYNLSNINKKYYNEFENSFDKKTSFKQYKVHCGDFLEQLGNTDFAMVTVEDIENYVNNYKGSDKTKANCKAHIRSMMIYVVKNDVEGALNKVSKEMLLYLI